MSSDSNIENNQQNDVNMGNMTTSNNNVIGGKTPLTFKDWKSLKESGTNAKQKRENKNFNRSGNHNVQGVSKFFTGNNGSSGIMPANRINNYSSNFGMYGSYFGSTTNGFNNFNRPNNNFNVPFNSGNDNFNNSIGMRNFTNSGVLNRFSNDRGSLNGPYRGNNFNLPESFFSSDGIYRQRDLMQQPLPNNNPFRNEDKAGQLLQEFDKSRYIKDGKKKKKRPLDTKTVNPSKSEPQPLQDNIRKPSNAPKVYVPNPKAGIDGKPYIPKPKLPEQNLEISKEEKKQQWKEYRQAMKPFKNRDFHNAKRVVQRLGKKPLSELDEKQKIRLTNATEYVEAHKAHLSAKYANYVKADDKSNDLGELYLLKKKPPYGSGFDNMKKPFQNYGNFPYNTSTNAFSSRKIDEVRTDYKRFVSGGAMHSYGTQ